VWLAEIGIGSYATIFADAQIDGAKLMALSEEDCIRQLHVSVLGHRKLLLKATDKLRNRSMADLGWGPSRESTPLYLV
jgi:hypothetical protein